MGLPWDGFFIPVTSDPGYNETHGPIKIETNDHSETDVVETTDNAIGQELRARSIFCPMLTTCQCSAQYTI